jgi:hypothetical protein
MIKIQDAIGEITIVEKEDETDSVLMEKPFNPSEIDITIKPLTIDLLIKRLKANPSEIELSPEFQRAESLWTDKQQSQLIESLLIKFPLPAFYFDGSDNNNWLVVDGLQRLSAIKNFTVLKTLRLTGMEFLSSLEGKGFDDLDRRRQRDIEEAQITAYVINPGTPEEVKFNIYKRLNTGGLVLTAQEIRHALNHGIPALFIAKLANISAFVDVAGGIPTARMLDREFVTRFLAFYLSPVSDYKPDIDTYMNEKMRAIKQISQHERDKIEYDFTASMKLAKEVFGKYAYRKVFSMNDRQYPINKALFEVWSVSFAKLTDNERDILYKKKDIVLNNFIKLMNEDSEFVDSISSSTDQKKRVTVRYEKIEGLIKGVIAL